MMINLTAWLIVNIIPAAAMVVGWYHYQSGAAWAYNVFWAWLVFVMVTGFLVVMGGIKRRRLPGLFNALTSVLIYLPTIAAAVLLGWPWLAVGYFLSCLVWANTGSEKPAPQVHRLSPEQAEALADVVRQYQADKSDPPGQEVIK